MNVLPNRLTEHRVVLLMAAVGSLVMLIARASRPAVVVLGRDAVGQFVNHARYPQAVETQGVLVIRSAGGWLYFNSDFIRRRILVLADASPAEGPTPIARDTRGSSRRPLLPAGKTHEPQFGRWP